MYIINVIYYSYLSLSLYLYIYLIYASIFDINSSEKESCKLTNILNIKKQIHICYIILLYIYILLFFDYFIYIYILYSVFQYMSIFVFLYTCIY